MRLSFLKRHTYSGNKHAHGKLMRDLPWRAAILNSSTILSSTYHHAGARLEEKIELLQPSASRAHHGQKYAMLLLLGIHLLRQRWA